LNLKLNFLSILGLVMAITRGFAGIDTLKRSWDLEKVRYPMIPYLVHTRYACVCVCIIFMWLFICFWLFILHR